MNVPAETRRIIIEFDCPKSGEIGRHDWAIGEKCEEGYPVFVDDRQLGYRKTALFAMLYAIGVINRLVFDGDYRLNDKPAGFMPPQIAVPA